MPKLMVATGVVENAVFVACRAPSYHNSQPWRWVAGRDGLHLFLEPDRLVATDKAARQALISCGAALDHARVAFAAAGWDTTVHRFPDPADPDHLASLDFTPLSGDGELHRRRADAILARRTDRLPFSRPAGWQAFENLLHSRIDNTVAMLDVIDDADRAELAEASQLTEALRLYDSTYNAELSWWTAPFEVTDGIPHSSLVSAAESDRVDVGRNFPITLHSERRLTVPDDQSKILLISAHDENRRDILGCGETLSTVLLEATMAGLATCTLTHVTELAASRDVVTTLTGRKHPEVLIRVGAVPALDDAPPPTPRRPLADVLQFRL
ncbi:MAG: NAD(P)H nitroreductase [Actinobacteria bacterium]|nr:NAD(P)H nitroreductase [Actinomycetota bacterium]